MVGGGGGGVCFSYYPNPFNVVWISFSYILLLFVNVVGAWLTYVWVNISLMLLSVCGGAL